MTFMRTLPLRWRLAIILVAVVVSTIGAVLVVVSLAAERVLVDSTAERLEIGAGLLADQPRRGPPVTELEASQVVRLLGGQETAVAIIDEGGSTLASADNGAAPIVADIRFTPGDYAAIFASGETVRRIVATDGERVLVVAAPIRLVRPGGPGAGGGPGRGGGPPFVPPGQARRGVTPPPDAGPTIDPSPDDGANAIAQLSVSLTPVDATIADLRSQLVWLGLFAVLVGLAATVVATRRVTRPLERVAAAAGSLASGDLSARTGLGGSDEVSAVGIAFDEMADRLQAAFRAQQAFAADASHELRTPLAVLGGYVDLLGRSDLPEHEERRVLGSMRREIDRLARLAGDLLLLAQIEAGGPTLESRPVDLADVVREVAEAGRMIDPAVEVRAVADGSLPATVDGDRIAQALMNLVANAVRHAGPGTPVVVRARRDEGSALVEVENTGTPIPADELPRIFERFVRRDAGRTGPEIAGHAGLGLPIARAIAEASGGAISARSDPAGTVFTIRLPLRSETPSQRVLSEDRRAEG
jgi:signal transduction histidine kinase